MPNIYLIGMPGSGKTTLGKEAAKQLNREFIDLDERIQAKAGQTIPVIFASQGESAFRQMESDTLKEVSQKDDCIVATGGGIVLCVENVKLMKKSGRVIFLHRPLARLLAETDAQERPLLAGDREERLRTLYEQRLPLYQEAGQETLLNDGDLPQGLKKLLKLLQ